jgi:hypothetical protein
MGTFDKRIIICKNVIFEGSYLKLILDKNLLKKIKIMIDLLFDPRFFEMQQYIIDIPIIQVFQRNVSMLPPSFVAPTHRVDPSSQT